MNNGKQKGSLGLLTMNYIEDIISKVLGPTLTFLKVGKDQIER